MRNTTGKYFLALSMLLLAIFSIGSKPRIGPPAINPEICEKAITYHADTAIEYEKSYPADMIFRIDPIKKTFYIGTSSEELERFAMNMKILEITCNLDLKTRTGSALYHASKHDNERDDIWAKLEFISGKLMLTFPRKKDSKENLGKYHIDKWK